MQKKHLLKNGISPEAENRLGILISRAAGTESGLLIPNFYLFVPVVEHKSSHIMRKRTLSETIHALTY